MMGKTFSKQTILSFSQTINGILRSSPEYIASNHQTKRQWRQELMRQLQTKSKPVSAPTFVPPVTKFIPRPVLLRSKVEDPKTYDRNTFIEPKTVPLRFGIEQDSIPATSVRRSRPNKRTRAKIRLEKARRREDERLSRAELPPLPTSQMTRRVRILTLASRIEFIQSLGLTVISLIETLKSFIYWCYYAITADDFGTISRIATYFNENNAGVADAVSRVFDRTSKQVGYLFCFFIYVKRYNDVFRSAPRDYASLNNFFLRLCEFEGIDYLKLLREDGSGLLSLREDVLEDMSVWHTMAHREYTHISNLLGKAVSRELTKIRGIRLFRNVSNTVLTLPLLRLVGGISTVPNSVRQALEALTTVHRPPGSESWSLPIRDEYADFAANVTRTLSIPELLNSAEQMLSRRRVRVEPTPE